MKQKLIFLIFIVLMIPQTVFAAMPVKETALNSGECGIVYELGILPAEKADAEIVSRADMAEYIVRLMNKSAAAADENTYKDVADEVWEKGYIKAASSMGVMQGAEGYFRPNDAVTVNEAIKILLSAGGYDAYAMKRGGYPNGYNYYAADNDLTDGITDRFDEPASYGTMVRLMKNALMMDYIEAWRTGEYVQTFKDKGETLLSRFHSVYEESGRITANYISGLASETMHTVKGYCMIEKTLFKDEKSFATQYLGYETKYFYRADKSGADLELIYAYPKPQVVVYEEISLSDIDKTEDFYKYIYDNGKNHTIKLAADVAVIYNRAAAGINSFADAVENQDGTVILIDNDNDGLMDVVDIKAITFMQVYYTVKRTDEIYDKSGGTPLDLSDKDVTLEIYKNGTEINFAKICAGDVLEITKSAGGSYIHIEASDKRLISGVAEYYGERDVIIDGKNFVIPKGVEIPEITAGVSGIFYISQSGYLVGADITSGQATQYGYLIAGGIKDDLSSTAELKILEASGQVRVLSIADNCRLYGHEKLSKERIIALAGAEKVIRYDLNFKNEISKLYLPQDKTNVMNYVGYCEEAFTLDRSATMTARATIPIALGEQCTEYLVTQTSLIFQVPTTPTGNDKDYKIQYSSTFVNDNKYNVDIYDSDKYKLPKAIVIKAPVKSTPGITADVFVIKSVKQVLGDDDNVKTAIEGYTSGKHVTYILSDALEEEYSNKTAEEKWNFGDIMQFNVTSDGEIIGYAIMLNREKRQSFNIWTTGTTTEPAEYVTGADTNMYDDRFLVYGETVNVNVAERIVGIKVDTHNKIHTFALSNTFVYLVDFKKETIDIATIADIKDGDNFFLRSRRQSVGDVVILQNE